MNFKSNAKNYIFLFLIFLNFSVFAQHWQDLTFNHLTVDNGLSGNRVYGVLQDKRVFLWIITNNGLNRYDGYDFKKYYFNPKDVLSISGNKMFSILPFIFQNLKNGFFSYFEITNGIYKLDKQQFIGESIQAIRNVDLVSILV